MRVEIDRAEGVAGQRMTVFWCLRGGGAEGSKDFSEGCVLPVKTSVRD